MAENVISFNNKKEKKETSKKLIEFMESHRKFIIAYFIIILVVVVAVCAISGLISYTNSKGISKIDAIEYSLVKYTADVSDEELLSKQDTALEELNAFIKKGSVVGVRANMLAADIYMQKKDYENSRTCWLAAENKGKKVYTAPICLFNAAVCSEELNDLNNAIIYYKKATEAKDFLLIAHTLFSLGRVQESNGDYNGAVESYKKIVDSYSNDSWADLAESRVIALTAEGKVTE